MRMLVPPIAQRREIDRKLAGYFHNYRPVMFRRAIADFCRFYGVKRPRIEWYEYIDRGRTAGRTFEDGRIHLVHPENWKRCRVYKSERMWVQTVYHELAHYVFWTDAERKADAFTLMMVRGLKRPLRRTRVASGLSRASTSGSSRREPSLGARKRHPVPQRSGRGQSRGRETASRHHPARIRVRRGRSSSRARPTGQRSDRRRIAGR